MAHPRTDWTPEADLEPHPLDGYVRSAIFSAYRTPACSSEPTADMTPVNGTRLLAKCAVGADLPPLEDLTYWAPPESSGLISTRDTRPATLYQSIKGRLSATENRQ
jgi:hypothetical protein